LVCAKKPTADEIPSALRANLDRAVLFRSSRLLASTVFGTVEELKFDPVTTPRGQAIAFIDGTTRYLQGFVSDQVVEGSRDAAA
jgi:hypothetical protein